MIRNTLTIALVFLSGILSAQSSFWAPSDTLNKPRLYTVAGVGGGAMVGSLVGLYGAWYADYPQSSLHFVDDNANWRYMDKFGHAYSTYNVGNASYQLLKWSGLDERRSVWYGGLSGWGYLAVIEIMDGMSDGWGFSTGDIVANSLGAGLFIGQQLGWKEQRIFLKLSYHPSEFAAYRPSLLGSTWYESILKDYNGQTYWLSVNPSSFGNGEGWWPNWLNVAVGYGATGMTGASSNPTMNEAGEMIPMFTRGSQYYMSLDIDLTRIPVKSHFWKGVFSVINVIKIPAPTLEYRTTDSKFYFHPIYF